MGLVWDFRKIKTFFKKQTVRLLPVSVLAEGWGLCWLSVPHAVSSWGGSLPDPYLLWPASPQTWIPQPLSCPRNPQISATPCGFHPWSPINSKCWLPMPSPPPCPPFSSHLWDGAPSPQPHQAPHTRQLVCQTRLISLPRAFSPRVDKWSQLEEGAAKVLWLSSYFSKAGLSGGFSRVTKQLEAPTSQMGWIKFPESSMTPCFNSGGHRTRTCPAPPAQGEHQMARTTLR